METLQFFGVMRHSSASGGPAFFRVRSSRPLAREEALEVDITADKRSQKPRSQNQNGEQSILASGFWLLGFMCFLISTASA